MKALTHFLDFFSPTSLRYWFPAGRVSEAAASQRLRANCLSLIPLFLTWASTTTVVSGATATFTGGAITVPIDGPADGTPYPAEITVAGINTATAVRVKLNNLSHTYAADLDFFLVAPNGQICAVMSDAAGDGPVSGLNLTIDDAAAGPLPAATPVSGSYQPTNLDPSEPSPTGSGTVGSTLAPLLTGTVDGVWKLYLKDDANQDGGSISSWALEFDYTPPPPVVMNSDDSGSGSLRQVIADATSGATITFDPSLSGQTITLGGTQLLIDKNLTIDGSALEDGVTISGNNSSRVFEIASGRTVEFTSLTISYGNGNGGEGGGIRNNGTLTINSSTISHNQAQNRGGGIYNAASNATSLVVRTSTISQNSVTGDGGGIHGAASAYDTTISANQASGSGGGWHCDSTYLIEDTIVAGNSANLISSGYDRSGIGFGLFDGVNLTDGDPMLAPLGDYGGPTETMPPLPGSPAIDQATVPTAKDQRGVPRPQGGAEDVGAVEALGVVDLLAGEGGIPETGGISLRAAIEFAAPGQTITFDPSLSGQTITLGGTQLFVDKDLAIDASGLTDGLTIDANGDVTNHRVLEVSGAVTVTIEGLTLTGGKAIPGQRGGGAIRLTTGANLTIRDSTISGNDGGGDSAGLGGGILVDSGSSLTVENSTIAGNVARRGGGIYSEDGLAITLRSVTISANTATANGGGIRVTNNFGTLDLANSIVAGNNAPPGSGTSVARAGNAIVTSSGANLIADNTTVEGTFPADGSLVGGGAWPPVDPLLAPLGFYGGRTQTMALLVGSPAIDAGVVTGSLPATDQRGFARVGTADVGAHEARPAITVTTSQDANGLAGSLRQAIADAVAPGTRILFDPSVFDGEVGDVIRLESELDIFGGKALFFDASNIPGGVTLCGGGAARIFDISGSTVSLDGLTLRDGKEADGGAIYCINSTVNLINATLAANQATSGGGGVTMYSSRLAVVNSTLNDNRAHIGGGIYNYEGAVELTNSTLSGNFSNSSGGAIANLGGLVNTAHVTLSGNRSGAGGGGGIYSLDTAMKEQSLVMRNTILAGNWAGSAADLYGGTSPVVVSLGGNVLGSGTDVAGIADGVNGDHVGTTTSPLDPRVGSLGDYGGPAATLPLLAGSPAIGAATGHAVPSTDQRGFSRVGTADSGAYEMAEQVVVASSGDSGAGTLREALSGAPARGRHISFDPGVFDGEDSDTISLNSELAVAAGTSVFIDAPGVTIDGGDNVRVFSTGAGSKTVIHGLTITGGHAADNGGGVFNRGMLTIASSTLSSNRADQSGGGVYNAADGKAVLRNVTLAGNLAGTSGGGVFNTATGTAALTNTTLSGNLAESAGGGVSNEPGGALALTNTLIANNRALANPDLAGAVTASHGGNLIGDGTGSTGISHGAGDLVGSGVAPIDAKLGPLGDYGGGTATMPLLVGSPAIDAGIGVGTVSLTDQRGFERADGKTPGGGGTVVPDVGASEAGTGFAVSNTADSGAGSLRQALLLGSLRPGQRVLFNLPADSVIGVASNLFTSYTSFIDASALIDGLGNLRLSGGMPVSGVTVSGGGTTRCFFLSGTIAMHSLTVNQGNAADGAGILNTGTLSLIDVTLSGNTATSTGGAILNRGKLMMVSSTLSGNVAGGGGGGLANEGRATLTNVTLSTNMGGIGGGIYLPAGSLLKLTNSTISNNTASVGGGGINTPGDGVLSVANSIIANNHAPFAADLNGAVTTSLGGNLVGDGNGLTSGLVDGLKGDRVGVDPHLGALADNGGPTQTMALLAGSPAIDGGVALAGAPWTDQRGYSRILNAKIDIGALESEVTGLSPTGVALHTIVSPAIAAAGSFVFEISRDPAFPDTEPAVVSTVAGMPELSDSIDGFSYPSGVAVDLAGNAYVADPGNHRIQKVSPDGEVSTLAGSGAFGSADGTGEAAQFAFPSGVAVDRAGNVYVADTFNHMIRKVTPAGVVSTLAGSGYAGFANATGSAAQFRYPYGVAVDADGLLFVADSSNHRIRKVTPTGVVSTLCGSGVAGSVDGSAGSARFKFPYGIAVDSQGSVFVADRDNHRIRKVSIASGEVSPFAGSGVQGFADGAASSAQFSRPTGVSVFGPTIYVSDESNHRIRKVEAGEVTTIAGSGTAAFADGSGAAAAFRSPQGLAVDSAGNLFVADSGNHVVRKVKFARRLVLAEAGVAGAAGIPLTAQVSLDPGVTYYYRLVSNGNVVGPAVRSILSPAPILVLGVDASTVPALDFGSTPRGAAPVSHGFSISNGGNFSLTISALRVPSGYQVSGLPIPLTLAVDDTIEFDVKLLTEVTGTFSATLVIDSDSANGRRLSVPLTGVILAPPAVVTLAASALSPTGATLNGTINPNGLQTMASFEFSTDPQLLGSWQVATVDMSGETLDEPQGVAVDGAGNRYVTDRNHHRILKVTAAGAVSTLAGSGVAGFNNFFGTSAQFDHPGGVAVAADGTVYVADTFNQCIRKITPSGSVSTFAGSGVAGFVDGSGESAKFLFPCGLAIATDGTLYVGDSGNHRIRKVTPAGVVSTLAGSGLSGYADAAGTAAQFSDPCGLAVDPAGNVFVADRGNHRIRKIAPDGSVSTVAGSGDPGFADGLGINAMFDSPSGVAVSGSDELVVADHGNHRLRAITSQGAVRTLAGSGIAGFRDTPASPLEPATTARFDAPFAIGVGGDGAIYVTEEGSQAVRRVSRAALAQTSQQVLNGTSVVPVSAAVPIPLLPGATYFFRAIGSSAGGVTRGASSSSPRPSRRSPCMTVALPPHPSWRTGRRRLSILEECQRARRRRGPSRSSIRAITRLLSPGS